MRIPGADGDLTAMPDHAPVITTLRPGILSVVTASGTQEGHKPPACRKVPSLHYNMLLGTVPAKVARN